MKTDWKQVKDAMRDDAARSDMTPADEFWTDFQARARLRTQEAPAAPVPWFYGKARLAIVAAAAVLLLAAGLLLNVGTGSAEASATTIKSVEIVASHSAVLIIKDEPSESAILWVVDMQEETDETP